MIRIAIVEDDESVSKELKTLIGQFMKKTGQRGNVSQFPSAESFLFTGVAQFDLVFMDIHLPKMDGMETAKKLKEIAPLTLLIFVTSLAQYALEGYGVGAFDFIVKPVSYYNLELKLQRAMKTIKEMEDEKIVIHNKTQTNVVSISDIYYVEIMLHKVIYYTKHGEYTTSGTMKKIVEELANYSFAICNQSYLVNLKYVSKIEGFTVTVAGTELAISRNKRNELKRALNEYLTKNS